jgi:hypothetical protein
MIAPNSERVRLRGSSGTVYVIRPTDGTARPRPRRYGQLVGAVVIQTAMPSARSGICGSARLLTTAACAGGYERLRKHFVARFATSGR